MTFITKIKPDFAKAGGLVVAITQDVHTKEVLMQAFMNEEAWHATLSTGEAHYYSRSRQELWHKGASSGHVQKIHTIRVDCDADAVLLLVEQKGAACHEGYPSCFFSEITEQGDTTCFEKVFDPEKVYKK